MRKYILLILALIFIAGCIGSRPVKVEANNGLKLVEFSADPTTAEFNDNVLFTVGIENVGGTTATGVKLTLFGIENIWRKVAATDIPAVKADAEKDYLTELFEPPVPSQNRPGDLKIYTKTLLPPRLPEGVTQDFPVTARATFDYSTSGSIIVPTISKSLLKIRNDKGEKVEDTPRVSNSDGPLKIGLSKGTLPIVVDDKQGGQQDATFVIEFVNVGDGFPVTETLDQAGKKKIGFLTGSIKIFGPGVEFDSVDGCLSIIPTPTNKEIVFTQTNVDLLKLRSSGRLPLSCTIKIDRTQFTPTTSGVITFSIDMKYKYFVEKTTNVRVIGTKEASAQACQTPVIPTPSPPATTICQSITPNSMGLVWNAVAGATAYRIEWCPEGTDFGGATCGSATAAETAIHTATALTANTQYNYRVRVESATSCVAPGPWSATTSCKTV